MAHGASVRRPAGRAEPRRDAGLHDQRRLIAIEIDDTGLPPPTPEIEQERRVAVFDLLEENSFALPPRDGQRAAGRSVPADAGDPRAAAGVRHPHRGRRARLAEFHLSLGPFRQVVKDYFQICESYFEAVKRLPPGQIEAIDMARRGIHNEGARVLQERLEGKAEVDTATARRLFTLICVLHWGG